MVKKIIHAVTNWKMFRKEIKYSEIFMLKCTPGAQGNFWVIDNYYFNCNHSLTGTHLCENYFSNSLYIYSIYYE
jgi:hypothetical protein